MKQQKSWCLNECFRLCLLLFNFCSKGLVCVCVCVCVCERERDMYWGLESERKLRCESNKYHKK